VVRKSSGGREYLKLFRIAAWEKLTRCVPLRKGVDSQYNLKDSRCTFNFINIFYKLQNAELTSL
jgi:hypothetical protein